MHKYTVFASRIPSCDGIAIDLYNNMYVGSRSENSLYKINPEGLVSKFAEIPCRELLCLTADDDGNIYAAGRDTLIKVSPGGEVKTLLDTPF